MTGPTGREAARIDAALADLAVLTTLGLSPPERLQSIAMRVRQTTPGVALVGLFNRGKSTLFNQLVGEPVSPVGALPTTAILIEARTGPQSAVARYSDRAEQLPAGVEAFARRLSELPAPRPLGASITGRFRLPPGLRLIDTPGAGAVSDLDEASWWSSSAGSAVLVTAVPPGPSAEEAEMLATARAVFDGRVAMVLKAVDADVDPDELAAVAARAEAHLGADLLVVPGKPPTGAWGEEDGWALLEAAVSDLAERAAEAVAADLHSLEDSIRAAAAVLETRALAPVEYEAWQRVSEAHRAEMSGLLRRTIETVSDRHRAEVERARLVTEQEERRRRVARASVIQHRRETATVLLTWLMQARHAPDGLLLATSTECRDKARQGSSWSVDARSFPELADFADRLARAAAEVDQRTTAVACGWYRSFLDDLFRQPVNTAPGWQLEANRRLAMARSWLGPVIGLDGALEVQLHLRRDCERLERNGPAWAAHAHEAYHRTSEALRTTIKKWELALAFSLIAGLLSLPLLGNADGQSTSGGSSVLGVVGTLLLVLAVVGCIVALVQRGDLERSRWRRLVESLPPPPPYP